ncbi:MAG: hypothetical protein QXW70_02455 [Candidatus Anstonellales archaeon]
MKSCSLLFTLIAISSLLFSGFSTDRFALLISIDEKGNTYVEERLDITITSQQSIALYRSAIKSTELAKLRDILNLSDVRYHISGAYTNIQNVRLRLTPPYWCNEFKATCQATVFLTYDVAPIFLNNTKQKSSVFFADAFKPRTTRYTLNTNSITIGSSEAGIIRVGRQENLTLLIPQNAKAFMQPPPLEVEERVGPGGKFKKYTWSGSEIFEFSFEYEESLESEVLGFFGSFQRSIQNLIFGPEGAAVIVIIVVVVGSYLYLNFIIKKNRQK